MRTSISTMYRNIKTNILIQNCNTKHNDGRFDEEKKISKLEDKLKANL